MAPYHHFECGTFLYATECIPDIEADYLQTQEKCQIVTPDWLKNQKLTEKVTGELLRLAAPLL